MKNKKITQILGVLILVTSGVAFGQTQVPNDFQAGQPARAAEVNANFDALESAVNDNATDIASNTTSIGGNATGISSNTTAINSNSGAIQANTQAISGVAAIAIPRVKANGQEIGTFLDGFTNSSLEHNWFITISILSDAGYIFTVAARDRGNETLGDVVPQLFWYETPDCTGTAYVAAQWPIGGNDQLQGLYESGTVFSSHNRSDPFLYYTPKGSMATTLTVQSQNGSSGGIACNAQTETMSAVPILLNDPFITGVANQRKFNPPITIGIQIIEIP